MLLNKEKLRNALLQRVEKQLSENKLAGAEIIVNQRGKRVCSLKLGNANGEGTTMYRIASMTKPVTAVAVMQQAVLGKIDMFAPVAKYLPEYEMMMLGHVENGQLILDRIAKEPIRVFHLLTHTSGIDVCPIYDACLPIHPKKTLQETARFFSKIPLAFEPFKATGYSQTGGFDVAARIVEIVSGEEYGEYVRRHIFDPLGMKDTTFEPTDAQWERMIPLHGRTENGEAFVATKGKGCVFEEMPPSCRAAGAGLASTAEDYMKFAEMLRRNGIGENGAEIVPREAVRQIAMPHVPESIMPGSERWGYGVRVVTGKNPNGLPEGAFGWSGAYGTHFWVDPVNDITALYMRNSVYDSSGCGSIGSVFEADVMSALE